ncbi:hypothetical protein CCHOA_08530 [Corynebacterium choanae]|uniref:Uncharacterized protein n=1 Tax=Corynebacterium choanae TaxID=1862358 RepID=A0A3G6J7K8_9CORY|nr:hypothetical protein CCHOA_08530 [Corynebacterium choanae]
MECGELIIRCKPYKATKFAAGFTLKQAGKAATPEFV